MRPRSVGVRGFFGLCSGKKSEGLIVAAALQIMFEPRMDGQGELLCNRYNPFRDAPQSVQVAGRIALVPGPVRDDSKAFLQGGRQERRW